MGYICKDCGKKCEGKKYPRELCQACYNYYRGGGVIYPLPKSGFINKDDKGYVICHICGKSYKRLGSHIKESHNMCIAEYKEKFGLCNNAKTTENLYSKKMHDYAYKYNMPNRLKVTGVDTRIKLGETDKRKGKPVRLQEIINKKSRNCINSTKRKEN